MMRRLALLTAFVALVFGCAKGERSSVVDLVKEVSSEARTKPQVKVSIHMTEDQPTPADEALLRSMEIAIERDEIGRQINSGFEPGYIFLTVEVENTADSIAKLRSILLKADVLKRSSFKVFADAQ